MKMWIALGRGKWGKQQEEQLRSEITVIISETCYVTLDGYITIMPVFLASLGKGIHLLFLSVSASCTHGALNPLKQMVCAGNSTQPEERGAGNVASGFVEN